MQDWERLNTERYHIKNYPFPPNLPSCQIQSTKVCAIFKVDPVQPVVHSRWDGMRVLRNSYKIEARHG